jgi:hypothetical protein
VFIFAGAKFGEIVLKWDAFNYATKFRAMAIYVILFECEIIIREEWDYGILPPSSIKGLPTDKNS